MFEFGITQSANITNISWFIPLLTAVLGTALLIFSVKSILRYQQRNRWISKIDWCHSRSSYSTLFKLNDSGNFSNTH